MVPIPGQDLDKTPVGDVLVKLNTNARFFWEDIPYGLVILKDIGNIIGVETPNITRNIIFHQKYMPVKYVNEENGKFNQEVLIRMTGAPAAYGIHTVEQLVKTSLQNDPYFMQENIYFRKSAPIMNQI